VKVRRDERLSGLCMMSVHNEKISKKTSKVLLKGCLSALDQI